jgi:hypothetical protein
VNFASAFGEDLPALCFNCFDTPADLVVCSCGLVFCSDCIERHVKNEDDLLAMMEGLDD